MRPEWYEERLASLGSIMTDPIDHIVLMAEYITYLENLIKDTK